jgi:hypothetical protein
MIGTKRACAIAAIAAIAGGWACGASDSASGLESGGAPAPAPRGDGGAGAAAPAQDAGPPPERELESAYQSPVATGKYVWIANPQSGRVAYVNASTLEVRTAEAGNGPTYMAPVPSPNEDMTVVLNTLSDDATLLAATSTGVRAKNFKVAHGANAWSVSVDGRWAISWTSFQRFTGADKIDKTMGFQDLTVIDLTGAVAPTVLAVGYRPVKVGFTVDSTRAYAVTQDGISVIDLSGAGGPLVTKNVPISDDPLEDPGTRDVSVTPDGAYALIRRDDRPDISVVDMQSATRTTVTLPGNVTDLDLSDTGERAVAVIRDQSVAAILPVPGIATQPGTFATVNVTGETIGSVALSRDGANALLYTNASAVERITFLNVTAQPQPTYRTIRLYSPVLAVFSTRDAGFAVVVHDRAAGSSAAGAFSVVPTGSPLPAKIVATQAPVKQVAIAPTNDRAFVTERDDAKKTYGVYMAKLPSLAVDRYPLASPPLGVGLVAGARRAWVAQEHPEGRITFIDLDTGMARTLTGFELGARVVDGSGK